MHDHNSSNPDKPGAYSISSFSAAFDIGRTKVYEEIAAGRLKARKCGARTLIPADAAQAWFQRLPAVKAAA